jgi:hypothetical protein
MDFMRFRAGQSVSRVKHQHSGGVADGSLAHRLHFHFTPGRAIVDDVSYQDYVPVPLGRADQPGSRLYSPRRHWLEISATLRTRIAR